MRTRIGKLGFAVLIIGLVVCLVVTAAPMSVNAETHSWRFNITNPSMDTTVGKTMQAFADNVKKGTNGRLDIQVFPGGTLGYNPFTVHRAVKQNTLEMAETVMAYIGEEPVYKVYSQICLFRDAAEANKATDVAWEELQAAAKKHKQLILMTYAYANDNLASVSKPLPNLASWKGEKIRAWNTFVAKWLSAVGAVPQVIPFNEKYTALAQGVIEGNFASPKGMLDTGDFEVTKYYNMWGVTSPIYFVIVNLQKYEALPDDVKKVLHDEAAKTRVILRKELAESAEADVAILRDKHKMTIVDVPEAEFEKARSMATKLWEDWAKEEAGPEARAVLKKVRAALGH